MTADTRDLQTLDLLGELRRGAPLPTARALAERLACSITTAAAIIGAALEAWRAA